MSPETHYPTVANEDGRLTFYISGPMTGLPDFNFPMFDAARDFLRACGHAAVSPADHDREVYPGIEDWPGFAEGVLDPAGPTFADLIGWDLRFIAGLECQAVLFLPGWEKSRGAAHERNTAEACGRRIFYFDPAGPSMYEERPTTLIGLSGYAQAGKDTAGELLVTHWGFKRVAFADALKDVLYDTNPYVLDDYLDAYDLSYMIDAVGWEKAKMELPSVRPLLQRLGVAVREHIDPDAWVNAAFRKLKPGGSYVITDVRFPNEAEAIRRRGGQLWRIDRPGTAPANGHVSETALDDHPFDALIVNDRTIEGLGQSIDAALHLA